MRSTGSSGQWAIRREWMFVGHAADDAGTHVMGSSYLLRSMASLLALFGHRPIRSADESDFPSSSFAMRIGLKSTATVDQDARALADARKDRIGDRPRVTPTAAVPIPGLTPIRE